MILGKKGTELVISKLINVIIAIAVLTILFYFLNQVSDVGNVFLSMFK